MKLLSSIRTRLLLVFLALAFVPLTLFAVMSSSKAEQELERNANLRLEEAAAQAMDKIERLLQSSSQSLRALAAGEIMQDIVADDADGRVTALLMRSRSEYKMFAHIYAVTLQGRIVASSEPRMIRQSVASQPWLHATKEVSHGAAERDPGTGTYAVDLYAPILATHDATKPIGYLVARFDWHVMESLLHAIVVTEGGQDRTGYALLVDQDGSVLSGPSFLAESLPASMRMSLSALGYPEPTVLFPKRQGANRHVTGDQELLIGYAHAKGHGSVHDLNWTVAIVHDIASAFGRIHELSRDGYMLFAALTILVVLAAWLLSRSLTTPIRRLTGMAHAIAGGDLSQQIDEKSEGEIGELARAFNRMTHDLTVSRTALLDANHALTIARDEALETSRLKSQFLANMSHEIRTPMNGVLGMTELLLNTSLSDKQHHFAQTIYKSGTALLDIINDILDFSKIEAGRLELESIQFDLFQLVEDVVDLFAERAQAKGLELAYLVREGVPSALQGDPIRLRQILVNLLGNAIKFTKQGEVVLTIDAPEQSAHEVVLRVTIKDTGIGIPAQKRERIFQAFSQADGSTTRQYGGTGLGLSIAKQLIEMMGGTIGLESEEGQGSVFWFTVRLAVYSRQMKKTPAERVALRGLRVLVVDDNATNRSILEHHLAAWDMVAESVESGPQALQALADAQQRSVHYDIAVLDWQMPVMDGFELAARIKSDPAFKRLPLIMLTSVHLEGDTKSAHDIGIAVFLTKPVRQSHLYDSIATVMAGTPRPKIARSVTATAPVIPTVLNGASIIVAEDNPVNRDVVKAMLASTSIHIHVAENGQEALSLLATHRVDLILMDCQMPVLDGFAATRKIREQEQRSLSHVPIVALTAHAIDGDREMCLSAGMDDYLSKPFSQEQLIGMIARWVASVPTTDLKPHAVQSASLVATPEVGPTAVSASQTHQPVVGGAIVGSGLDSKTVTSLRALRRPGAPDVFGQLCGTYLESSQQQIQLLETALGQANCAMVFQTAHALKSSSAMIGALRLAELAKELEGMGRRGDLSGAVQLQACIIEEYELVQRALQAFLPPKAA